MKDRNKGILLFLFIVNIILIIIIGVGIEPCEVKISWFCPITKEPCEVVVKQDG